MNNTPLVLTPTQIFRKVFPDGGTNFMTPTILKRGKINVTTAWELSRGTGFDNEIIYGVTVVGWEAGEAIRYNKVSKCCFSKKDAMTYIKEVKALDLSEHKRD